MAATLSIQDHKFTRSLAKAFATARLLNPGHISRKNIARVAGMHQSAATHAHTLMRNYGLIEWCGDKPGHDAYRLTAKGAAFPIVPVN